MFSKLQWAVLSQLVKAWKLGLDVSVSRIVRVFNLNSLQTYRFIERLEREGVVEKTRRGWYRFRDTSKTRALAELVSMKPSRETRVYSYFSSTIPEIYYYFAEPPSIEWLGFARELVVIDERLKNRVRPPHRYRVVYTSFRGRKWRYDWDLGVSRAYPEQAVADLLEYDPFYPVEQYIFLNLETIDLDEVAKRIGEKGFKRLSTFLAFLRISVGRSIPASFNYIEFTDREVLEERLSEYIGLVYGNGVAEKRGI